MIPPRPQAAKYFPLYSSILGFGSAFSTVDMLISAAQILSFNCVPGALYRNVPCQQGMDAKTIALTRGMSIEQKEKIERGLKK